MWIKENDTQLKRLQELAELLDKFTPGIAAALIEQGCQIVFLVLEIAKVDVAVNHLAATYPWNRHLSGR